MALGNSIRKKDSVIKATKKKVSKESKISVVSKRAKMTEGTSKQTFYIKDDLLEKFYNYCYWHRMKVTDGINALLAEALKGKTTKKID